jgi:hypothetical protein
MQDFARHPMSEIDGLGSTKRVNSSGRLRNYILAASRCAKPNGDGILTEIAKAVVT